jgi:beta-phosphoglucomutase-like phosphatase (HAD superfamily)
MFDAIVGNDVQCKTKKDQVFFTNVNSYNTTRKCICFEDSVAGVQATNTANIW